MIRFLARRKPDLSADLAWAEKQIADLNTEAEQTAIATTAMHHRQQETIGKLRAEKVQLRGELREAHAALKYMADRVIADKQSALDKAQAEVKRLDAALVAVDAENVHLHGQLATAEEQLASYQKAAA